MNEVFGPHLTIDGKKCDKSKLSDLALVFKVLDDLPSIIGMTKIMPPYSIIYHGAVPKDWGISGFVMIAESHISIHTFPEKEFVFIDLFSCKMFDVEKAIKYLVDAFGIKDMDKEMVKRGICFPRN